MGNGGRSAIGMAAYGLVIHDPTGALAERKQAFASACYTEDMRRWRIAGGLWNIWQFGEYKVNTMGSRASQGGVTASGSWWPRAGSSSG